MRTLYIFVAHIDDLEFACLGYVFNNKYDKVKLVVATTWPAKEEFFKKNLDSLRKSIDIEYINLGFPQRVIPTHFDEVKDKFYKLINFSEDFDILTHDKNDAHTDHTSVFQIAFGVYKYCNKFITIYSPEMVNFTPNYFVEMSPSQVALKKELLATYDFGQEQSYTKKGTYFEEERLDLPTLFALDMFHNKNVEACECYKIYKWLD